VRGPHSVERNGISQRMNLMFDRLTEDDKVLLTVFVVCVAAMVIIGYVFFWGV
jgi:hypothetical protein